MLEFVSSIPDGKLEHESYHVEFIRDFWRSRRKFAKYTPPISEGWYGEKIAVSSANAFYITAKAYIAGFSVRCVAREGHYWLIRQK